MIFRKIIKDYAMKDDAKKGTNNKNVIDMINLMLYYTHTLYYIIYSDRTNSTNYLFISQVESIRWNIRTIYIFIGFDD